MARMVASSCAASSLSGATRQRFSARMRGGRFRQSFPIDQPIRLRIRADKGGRNEHGSIITICMEHDLFRKPASAFRDHALVLLGWAKPRLRRAHVFILRSCRTKPSRLHSNPWATDLLPHSGGNYCGASRPRARLARVSPDCSGCNRRAAQGRRRRGWHAPNNGAAKFPFSRLAILLAERAVAAGSPREKPD